MQSDPEASSRVEPDVVWDAWQIHQLLVSACLWTLEPVLVTPVEKEEDKSWG